jgi:hypothetical protein
MQRSVAEANEGVRIFEFIGRVKTNSTLCDIAAELDTCLDRISPAVNSNAL